MHTGQVFREFLEPDLIAMKNLLTGLVFLFGGLVLITLTWCRNEFVIETQQFGPCISPYRPVMLFVAVLWCVQTLNEPKP